MTKYKVEMFYEYNIETDNLEEAMSALEFPTFPTIEDDDKVSFIYNINHTSEIGQ